MAGCKTDFLYTLVGFLPHGPQWWLCYAKLDGPGQATPSQTGVDVQVFVGLFEAVFETFLLPSKGPVIIYRLGGKKGGGGVGENFGLNKVKFSQSPLWMLLHWNVPL